MRIPPPPRYRKDFDVAIICALPLEADAVEAVFDHFWDEGHDNYGKASGDKNAYRTGRISNYNVVLAYMPGMGKGNAATVAANLRTSFQGIRLALVVGICGGVPTGNDSEILLGDVIISGEIVAYDFGKKLPAGFRRKETFYCCSANDEVQAFMAKIKSRKGQANLLERTSSHLSCLQDHIRDYDCPDWKENRLFEANYPHKHRSSECTKCNRDEICEAQTATCETLGCDESHLVYPWSFPQKELGIHFGRMASGDTVMKSGADRDRIAVEENVIAFEMEGAGITNSLPCLVVKGVCDYADSHKNNRWQKYTAGVAAACMKSLLEQWASIDSPLELYVHLKDGVQDSPCSIEAGSPKKNHEKNLCQAFEHEETQCSQRPLEQNKYNDDLLEARSTIQFRLRTLISFCKQYRKYLPRDSDPKRILPTQKTVLLSNIENLTSKDSGSNDETLDSPRKLSLEIILAIQTKLKEIENLFKCLPPYVEMEMMPVGFKDQLKSTAAGNAIWINVESAIKNLDTGSRPVSDSLRSPGESPLAKRQRLAEEPTNLPPSRKRVGRLQLPDELKAPSSAGEPVIKIPNLYLQRNLCTVIGRALNRSECNGCIGLLGENDTCKHLAYIDGRIGRTGMPASLSELILISGGDVTEGMGLYERVRLARHLATAVLYYHATPWLNKPWRSDDVQFFVDQEDPTIQFAKITLPYITTSIQANDARDSSSQPLGYHHFIRNPVLFGQGIMLLELAYQTPLKKLQRPIDLEKGGSQGFADYFTAHRLVENIHRKVSTSFKIMIKKSLHCDFGHDNDFASSALQEAFYNDIIVGLENLEKTFQDLQLDNPKSA
ncbi:hypothetical protein N7540_002144 [Penicillium herquei]|nr:hypothetical protein N7540_002144 [Penicillium herquei]